MSKRALAPKRRLEKTAEGWALVASPERVPAEAPEYSPEMDPGRAAPRQTARLRAKTRQPKTHDRKANP